MSSSTLAAGIRHLRGRLAARQRHEESDEQLLHAFLSRRDDGAFDVLVRRHGPMVLRVCRRALGHQQDAEDAFQATFLVLAQSAASLRDKTALASFLHGTAHRLALKAKRAAARRRRHEVRTPARLSVDPADELCWREVQTLLDEEIARLPQIYRSVFILCRLENLSRAEAAQRLGLKERTVLSRLAVARKRLQARLARRGVELTALLAAATLTTETASALPAVLFTKAIGGAVSPAVAALAESAVPILGAGKIKAATVLLLAASVLTGAAAFGLARKPKPPTQPSAAKTGDKTPAAPAQRDVVKRREIRGQVLDPDGKPLRGAKLFVSHVKTAESISAKDIRMAFLGASDADGRFHFTFDRAGQRPWDYLLAHAAGWGVDWIELGEREPAGDVTLRLVKDVPITGRVVNTEGRPVAGASVSAASLYLPANGKMDDYLASWLATHRTNVKAPPKRLNVPLDNFTGAATTDKDGRFTLHGAGGERIVGITFSGGGMARETLHALTRPGFDAAPYNAVLRKEENKQFLPFGPFRVLNPPSFTLVAQPGKTIEGAVKDAASGKPLPGCWVSASMGWDEPIRMVSDAGGKYHLDGVPKNTQGYSVSVGPPKDAAYLARGAHVADTAGLAKVQLDFALVQGVIVTGRVLDKQTDKGVRSSLVYAPLLGNKFIGSKPGFTKEGRNVATDKTGGRFRFVAIPGRALLNVHVLEREKIHGEDLCVYRWNGPDSDHKDLFNYDPEGDSWQATTADGPVFITYAAKVIDVKESGETRVDIYVERGATARIAVRDAEGKPLAGAWAVGLTDGHPSICKLPEATATVYGLNPAKPRTMAFLHAEKKLGGTAIVRGDEKEPVVVKLAPVGKVSGRVVDEEGNALKGVEVSLYLQVPSVRDLYRIAAPNGKLAVTDKDGRFHLQAVVPGLKFYLILRQGSRFLPGSGPRLGYKQVKSGEALDMGDIRVKPGPSEGAGQ